MDEKQRYIFIDVETTGLNPEENDVIEVAMLVYDDDNEIARMSTQLRSAPGLIDLNALKVNKVRLNELYSASTGDDEVREAVVRNLAQFLIDYVTKDTWFVGHHVSFDYSFLKALFETYGLDITRLFSPINLLCTKQIAMFLQDRGEMDLKNFRMITLWNELFEGEGEYEDNAHSAMKDAMMVKDIYFKLRN